MTQQTLEEVEITSLSEILDLEPCEKESHIYPTGNDIYKINTHDFKGSSQLYGKNKYGYMSLLNNKNIKQSNVLSVTYTVKIKVCSHGDLFIGVTESNFNELKETHITFSKSKHTIYFVCYVI